MILCSCCQVVETHPKTAWAWTGAHNNDDCRLFDGGPLLLDWCVRCFDRHPDSFGCSTARGWFSRDIDRQFHNKFLYWLLVSAGASVNEERRSLVAARTATCKGANGSVAGECKCWYCSDAIVVADNLIVCCRSSARCWPSLSACTSAPTC